MRHHYELIFQLERYPERLWKNICYLPPGDTFIVQKFWSLCLLVFRILSEWTIAKIVGRYRFLVIGLQKMKLRSKTLDGMILRLPKQPSFYSQASPKTTSICRLMESKISSQSILTYTTTFTNKDLLYIIFVKHCFPEFPSASASQNLYLFSNLGQLWTLRFCLWKDTQTRRKFKCIARPHCTIWSAVILPKLP